MDARLLKGTELTFAQMLADSGIQLVQYRNKQASPKIQLEMSRKLTALLRPQGVRVIVNDRADVAALADADGVHLGQEDLPPAAARRICGEGREIGLSTHSLAQAREAANSAATYVAVGPVYPTSTKENPEPTVGLELIRQVRGLTSKPLVGIGGITLEHAAEVFAAGADSVAVAGDLIAARDPRLRTREFLELAERHFKNSG